MEFRKLSPEQKLEALSLKHYQKLDWTPKKGDYYTSSRNDLELYRIIDEDDKYFFTTYCDEEREGTPAMWEKDQFLKDFGEHRVFVPDAILKLASDSAQL